MATTGNDITHEKSTPNDTHHNEYRNPSPFGTTDGPLNHHTHNNTHSTVNGYNNANADYIHNTNSVGHHGIYHGTHPMLAGPHGGSLQPGLWRPYEHRKFANPAPLGLSAFALTTFVLSCINLHTRGTTVPNVVVSLAFAYGGLVQLLAGMW